MRKKLLSYISNSLLIAGIIIGVYVLADIYLIGGNPAGTCPVSSNRPLIYTALVLCIGSLAVSFFEPKKTGN